MEWSARQRWLAAIDAAVGEGGVRVLLLLRLSPVVPFSLLNYILGITRTRLVDYVMASVGMLPGTVGYVYFGSLLSSVRDAARGATPGQNGNMRAAAIYWSILGAGLVATVVALFLVGRAVRRELVRVGLVRRDAADVAPTASSDTNEGSSSPKPASPSSV